MAPQGFIIADAIYNTKQLAGSLTKLRFPRIDVVTDRSRNPRAVARVSTRRRKRASRCIELSITINYSELGATVCANCERTRGCK